MDLLKSMQIYVAVVDAGSFVDAADQLGTSNAAVSRYLAALEEHLGVRLLTRTTRRLALTEEGRDYLDACRRVLADIEDAERRVAGRHGLAEVGQQQHPPPVVPVVAGCTTGVAPHKPSFCPVVVPILLPVVPPRAMFCPSASVKLAVPPELVPGTVVVALTIPTARHA